MNSVPLENIRDGREYMTEENEETEETLVAKPTVETEETEVSEDTEDTEETVETVETVENVETEETVFTEDLKKVTHSLTHSLTKKYFLLLTANTDTRDASASKNVKIKKLNTRSPRVW